MWLWLNLITNHYYKKLRGFCFFFYDSPVIEIKRKADYNHGQVEGCVALPLAFYGVELVVFFFHLS